MKSSVVSKEYLALQKEIIKLQEQWQESIGTESIHPNFDKAAQGAGIPIAMLAAIDFNITQLIDWVNETGDLLVRHNPHLEADVFKLKKVVDEETIKRWIDEAFAINHIYFAEFAGEHQLQEWLPQFIAETVLRPYLHLLAKTVQPQITKAVPGCGCPVCGEPVRLGQIEGKGQKVLHCPRCHAHWLDKKLTCAHCGNDDHSLIKYLTVEGDASSQIHVCEKCKGYTKIIDTRQHLEKPIPQLLDITTIHLDYIAQEKGYSGIGNVEE
jgi:FdhE protein